MQFSLLYEAERELFGSTLEIKAPNINIMIYSISANWIHSFNLFIIVNLMSYNILIVRMRVFAVLKLKGKTSGGQAITGL